MKSIRKYNNNVILADDDGQEVVVLGKGLGFNANPGAPVDVRLVEKVFVPQETAEINRSAQIISDLPYEYILFASKVVDYSKCVLTPVLNQSIVIALADHLAFAVSRLKQGLDTQMPLLLDIRHIYPVEFRVGEWALERLKEEFDADFPKSEAAAIALHFVNAESEGADMPNTFKVTTMMKDTVKIIEDYYGLVFDENSFEFMGFLAHLRNGLFRYMFQGAREEASDEGLYRLIRSNYPEAFVCTEKVVDYFQKTGGYILAKNDFSFLTLHISRIVESARRGQ